MSALLGRYTLSDGSQGEMIPVVEHFVHPSYDPETMKGDIAILRLERAAPADIPIIPLIPAAASKTLDDGKMVTVLGWGLQEERSQMATKASKADETVQASGSDSLRSVTLPIVDNAKCNAEYKELTSKDSILAEQVCAGTDRGGLDSCQGDSGGPLVATVGDTTYLFGVVSWGIGCARPKVPGVYTRVAFHAEWLASKMLLEVGTISGRGLGATNVLFAGTDRPAQLSVLLNSLAPEALDVSVGFAKDVPSGFSVDAPKVTLAATGQVEKTTITYASGKPGVETTDLVLGVTRKGKATAEQTFGLTAFALPPAELLGGDWYTGADSGDSQWLMDGEEMNSGKTADSQTTVALHYFTGAGELSFQWRASCEETYDLFYMFLDNEPVDALTGNSGWVTKSLLIEGGPEEVHTVAFAYVKDKSMAKFEDRAYVKDLHFGPRAQAGMERLAPLKAGKRALRGAAKEDGEAVSM